MHEIKVLSFYFDNTLLTLPAQANNLLEFIMLS